MRELGRGPTLGVSILTKERSISVKNTLIGMPGKGNALLAYKHHARLESVSRTDIHDRHF